MWSLLCVISVVSVEVLMRCVLWFTYSLICVLLECCVVCVVYVIFIVCLCSIVLVVVCGKLGYSCLFCVCGLYVVYSLCGCLMYFVCVDYVVCVGV